MKNKKSYRPALVIIILFLCLGIFVFLDMNKEDSEDSDVYSGSSHTAREEKATTEKATTEEAPAEEIPEEASSAIAQEPYLDEYPYYGMREANLKNCRMGEPWIVSENSHFEERSSDSKIRYYYFGVAESENSGKIIVRYRWYDAGTGEYVDLPSDNGYVDSGYYIDEDWTEYQIEEDGNYEVETAPEATTESGKKTGGGGLWPKDKNRGKGSESGGSDKKDSTSATTEFDPDDHDIEGYYEDNKDEYDDIDDAYDGFEDDEEAWDDY